MRTARVALAVCLITGLSGCAKAPEGFDSPEPAARLRAAVKAADTKDPAAIPDLIELLESDDPAVRLVAIRGLERITGQTLGYDYSASPWDREQAVEQWWGWYRSQEQGGGG